MSPHAQNTAPASLAPRKRGGQPGNTNSLKHGYYSTRFSLADLTDLENHSFSGLHDEITMLRVYREAPSKGASAVSSSSPTTSTTSPKPSASCAPSASPS